MRPSQLRLLPVYACLVAGAVILPVTAIAEPSAPVPAHQVHAAAPAAHLVVVSEDPTPAPPVWLLLLLGPVLIGGAVGVGVTLRRLR